MARAFKLVGKLIGLTGNIGSGKSTVARMFAARGIPVIDADGLLREVQAPGQPAHAEIAAAWPEAVAPDGGIDRKRLGRIVFADPAARKRLEAITHPRIQELSRARAAALADAGHELVLYEAPCWSRADATRSWTASSSSPRRRRPGSRASSPVTA